MTDEGTEGREVPEEGADEDGIALDDDHGAGGDSKVPDEIDEDGDTGSGLDAMSQADDENSVALFTERSTGSKESAAPSIASSTIWRMRGAAHIAKKQQAPVAPSKPLAAHRLPLQPHSLHVGGSNIAAAASVLYSRPMI